MKKRFRTPGVFVEEISIRPRSIAQVETAIPAFIGYTEQAGSGGNSLLNTPTRVSSFLEFNNLFGSAFPSRFELSPAIATDPNPIKLNGKWKSLSFLPQQRAFLYYSVKAFFENGGGTCFIVSVGTYGGESDMTISKNDLLQGISRLAGQEEPSILAIPDAVLLGNDSFEVYLALLAEARKNFRFAILDIPDGDSQVSSGSDCIATFRSNIGNQNLSFGAAYYPWLYSNLATGQGSVLTHLPLINFQKILPEPHAQTFLSANPNPSGDYLHQVLKSISPTYLELWKIITIKMGLIPASGFLAGIYARTDRERGLWEAPANASLMAVNQPSVSISQTFQEDLNTSSSGKSINAIREFPGKGILVWGARTLAGNDLEYRYISVRRTVTMVEHSLSNGLNYAVFEPNDANTWAGVKSQCSNFLTELWRTGALTGTKSEHAFYVKVGLGETMTSQDIINKQLIVEIGMALVRPAEFTIIRILKKSA